VPASLRRLGILAAGALVAVFLGAVSSADVAPWLGPGWSVRRVVDVQAEPSPHPGEEVAVCAFYSGGMIQPDGRDIRVAAQGRDPVPHRVLQMGPGDFVRVAFALAPGGAAGPLAALQRSAATFTMHHPGSRRYPPG